jgi:diketogulonate reductase-like aldo/keto reductase
MEIAAQLAKTPAQVLLRWAVQQNVVVIPKSLTPARIEENFNIFDFELNKEHMEALGSLNKNYRFVKPQFYDFPEDRI